MRSLAKALLTGLALCASLSMLPRTDAGADPLAGYSYVTDSGVPNQTWKLFRGSFSAGDQVTVTWRGRAHLRLSVYDRVSGDPVLDGDGNPVTVTYAGTPSLFSYTSLTLTLPVDADDAVLVVKNPDKSTGFISFYLYSYDSLTYVNPPSLRVLLPWFWPSLNGVTLSYAVQDLGGVTAFHVNTTILVQYVDNGPSTVLAGNGIVDCTAAPGVIVPSSVTLPWAAYKTTVQVSTTTYGETSTANYNFLVP